MVCVKYAGYKLGLASIGYDLEDIRTSKTI